jgi:hypothetical protein
MKSVFDETTRTELIRRIDALDENSRAQWGNMNLYQMLKHCSAWEDLIFGRKKYKRAFAGYLFGKMALKAVLKDDKPLRRSTPTIPALVIKEIEGDSPGEKKQWIEKVREYAHFPNHGLVHPFFGKMTREQVGYLVYKHIDHHLRQFNA